MKRFAILRGQVYVCLFCVFLARFSLSGLQKSLLIIPIILSHLLNVLSICWLKSFLKCKINPKCFWLVASCALVTSYSTLHRIGFTTVWISYKIGFLFVLQQTEAASQMCSSNLLKAVFYKFYLVWSWIFCSMIWIGFHNNIFLIKTLNSLICVKFNFFHDICLPF